MQVYIQRGMAALPSAGELYGHFFPSFLWPEVFVLVLQHSQNRQQCKESILKIFFRLSKLVLQELSIQDANQILYPNNLLRTASSNGLLILEVGNVLMVKVLAIPNISISALLTTT